MNVKQLAATLLAGLIVTAGAAGAVAAAPGNGVAPDDTGPNDNANATADAAEDDPMNASDDAEDDESMNDSADADEDAADAADADQADAADAADERRGPPTNMPEQVPDHVVEIHELINGHLEGAISDLGGAISDVTPDDEQSDETADEEQADANASATPTDVPA